MEVKKRILKKISLITIVFLMNFILGDCIEKVERTTLAETKPAKVSVLIWDFNDKYHSFHNKVPKSTR